MFVFLRKKEFERMKELCEAIRTWGRGVGNDVAKVDMFLNHRIDTELLFKMGEAFAEEFRDERPTMILTVESSGIALAVAAAKYLDNIPVVFAKKSDSAVLSGDVVSADVFSFTKKKQYSVRVEKRYIPIRSRVLVIDDFLADGQAVHGMVEICEKLDAKVVGVGIAVEKGFQNGGMAMRAKGVHLKSLAIIDKIEDGKIILRDE